MNNDYDVTSCSALLLFFVRNSHMCVHTHARTGIQCDAIVRNNFRRAAIPMAINSQLFWGQWQRTHHHANFIVTSLLLSVCASLSYFMTQTFCWKPKEKKRQKDSESNWAVISKSWVLLFSLLYHSSFTTGGHPVFVFGEKETCTHTFHHAW